MKVISFVNQKGGVGKTASAVSVASYLSKKNKVLLLDLDTQGNATLNSGIDIYNLKYTMKELLLSEEIPVRDLIINSEKGYDVIGSNLKTADVEMFLSTMFNREYILKERMAGCDYDYIIIDCSPNLSLITVNALMFSNLVLIPLIPQKYAIVGVSALMRILNLVKKGNNGIKHKYFITQFDGRMNNFKAFETDIRESPKDDVLKTKIRVDNTMRIAQDEDKTIFEIKNSKCAEDYAALVEEIISE